MSEVEEVSRTLSPSANRAYGLALVCRSWRMSRAALYRRRQADPERERRRPGPEGAMPDAALADRIREFLADSPFHGEG